MSLTVEKCLQAWTNSLRQMNAKADIVFLGDSLTYYGNFSSVFLNKVVCNLGLRGDTIQGMIERVGQVGLLEPKIVYLMAGINDVIPLSLEAFKNNYLLLVDAILNTTPESNLIIQSILPVNSLFFGIICNNEQIIKCNRCIKEIADDKQLCYLDLFSDYIDLTNYQLSEQYTIDGIHLQNNAYFKWYDMVALNYDMVALNIE